MTYGFSYAPYNDLQAFKDACTENTIAIMVEPVQGEGVYILQQWNLCRDFVNSVMKTICSILIDEVQTEWCRAGAVMSYMNYGIKQDIVALYYKAL